MTWVVQTLPLGLFASPSPGIHLQGLTLCFKMPSSPAQHPQLSLTSLGFVGVPPHSGKVDACFLLKNVPLP